MQKTITFFAATGLTAWLCSAALHSSMHASASVLPQNPASSQAGSASLPTTQAATPRATEILWVESNGISGLYSSIANYSRVTLVLDNAPQVNLSFKRTGMITKPKLDTIDIAIIPTLSNANVAWTTAELDAFEDFVKEGGCLYIWTDNPNESHVAVDPLLARFGLGRDNSAPANSTYQVTFPKFASNFMQGTDGGGLTGGTRWLESTTGEDMAVFQFVDQGRVYVLGDCDIYANSNWDTLENSAMLKQILKRCVR